MGRPIRSGNQLRQIILRAFGLTGHLTRLTILLLPCILAYGAPRNESPAMFRDGVVLVSFQPDVSEAQAKVILSGAGAIEMKRIGVGVHVLQVPPGRVPSTIQSLKGLAAIRYVEPDYLQTLSAGSLPNDTNISNQWAVQNTGQTVNGGTGIVGADERLPLAWSMTTGTNSVVVAILDTGVQYSHPDLLTNMWNNPGGIGGCSAGTHGYNVLTQTCDPMDDDTSYGGHGTHVAGILGAIGNNAAGVAGVNWTTSIMAVKWVTANSSGATSDLITAMDWVIHAKQAGVNVRVANDSATWPGTGFSQALSDEIDLLGSNDILFVTAAGNTAQDNDTIPRYPCSYNRPNMLCVGASDQMDNLWSSSNYGTTTVKLAASGVNIYSTLRLSNYGYISGTSMASPQVAGTAALILSNGYVSVANLRTMILNHVDVLPSLSSYVSTGGRLNVCKSVPGCTNAVSGMPANVSPPIITGVAQYGSLMAASTGSWSGVPTRYSYQWYRCAVDGTNCSPIPGASSPLYAVLAQADVGGTLGIAVTASNTFGSATTSSVVSAAVVQGISPFAISSTILDGTTLTGTAQWQATSSQQMNFVQFYVDGVLARTSASSPYVYTLDSTTLANGTHVLGIRALSNDNRTYGFYGAAVTVTNAVPPVNTALPAISGNPAVGQILTVSSGTWSNNPTTYSYQWRRCDFNGTGCLTIQGASSSSYTVQASDAGLTLCTSVTATNTAGSSTVTSVTIAIPASGGIALRQWNAVEGTSARSIHTAFLSSNTAGNLIIAFVRMSSTSQTVTITDSLGNSYARAVSQTQTSDGHQVHIFYAKNIVGGANTVTAAFSASNNHPWLAVYEYSGLSATNPLDQTAHAQGSNASPSSGASAMTTNPNELMFSGIGIVNSYAGTTTAGANYALQQQDTGTSRAATETTIATSTAAFTGTFALSAPTNWSVVLATFAAESSGTGGPAITTNTVPNGTVNTPYSTTVTASGGVIPYSWSITSGSLPAGLSLAAGSGAVSGTPTGAGTSTFTLQVTDTNGMTGSKAFTITVSSGAGAPAITTSTLPNGTVNTPYSTTVTASGGVIPYSWSITSGSLPAGLSLAAGSGAISGTPTGAGTSTFTLQVTDTNGMTGSKAFTITINFGIVVPIVLLQSNAVERTGATSIATAFQVANTAGNLIVAFVRMSSSSQTVTISDSAGNGYVDAVSQVQTSDGHQVHIFYAKNITGGANTVTATFSATNNHPWLAVYEYSGLSATNPLDQTAHAQGSNASPSTGASGMTANANELVFAAMGIVNNFTGTATAGSNYMLQLQDTGTSRAATETAIATSTGAFTGTFTLSAATNWSAVLATFQQ
jgi:subtilisin family serine protease